ncbi:MAG: alpha/beta fold hydrolase [Nitrospinota bacterium]
MAQPTNSVTRFVLVRDVKVRLMEGGEGPPLLYFHGAGQTGVWMPFHEELAGMFKVYAPDHPGFGQSDRPDWLDGMDDLVYHYLDLLDLLELERVAIVGSSFGGWLAAEFATAHPERVTKLVLSGAAGLRVDRAPIADLFLMDPAKLAEYLFADPEKVAQAASAELPPELQQEMYRGRVTLAHLGWDPLLCNPALRRRLYRITCPTLVLWGAQDRLIPPAHGEVYASEIPNARLVKLEGCAHSIQLERPGEFAAEVTKFIMG